MRIYIYIKARNEQRKKTLIFIPATPAGLKRTNWEQVKLVHTFENVINNTKCDAKEIKGIYSRKWAWNKKVGGRKMRARMVSENVLIFNSPHTHRKARSCSHTNNALWVSFGPLRSSQNTPWWWCTNLCVFFELLFRCGL